MSACAKCEKPDTDEMVCCDECDDWYHFDCAEVDKKVKKVEWLCDKCKRKARKANEKIIAQLDGLVASLKFHLNYFEQTDAEVITLDGYECRLNVILPLFDRYQEHSVSLSPTLKADEKPAHDLKANEFATHYFTLIASLKEKIRVLKNATAAAHVPPISQSSNTARTPKLTVPTFDGTSDKWIKFRDLFESMIHHKTNLSNIEKFSYLHASIQLPSGQTNVLDNFKICDDDYQAAWAAICERYNDKRKIIRLECVSDENI